MQKEKWLCMHVWYFVGTKKIVFFLRKCNGEDGEFGSLPYLIFPWGKIAFGVSKLQTYQNYEDKMEMDLSAHRITIIIIIIVIKTHLHHCHHLIFWGVPFALLPHLVKLFINPFLFLFFKNYSIFKGFFLIFF